jgi:hypothetical protein
MLPRHRSVGSLTWVVAALVAVGTGCDRVFQLLEVSEAPSDALEADADTTDAAPDAVIGPCFYDDFNAPFVDDTKWSIQDAAPTATVSQQSGVLVLSLGQATGAKYATVLTELRDFTHDAVSIEIIEPPSDATSAEAGISLFFDNLHRISFFVSGANLLMRITNGGPNDDDAITYSVVAHRFLRIRHSPLNNLVLWETSADGTSWALRRMAMVPLDLTNLRLKVFGGTFQQEATAPGQPKFDNALIECFP